MRRVDTQTGYALGTISHYAAMAMFMLRPGSYTYNQILGRMTMALEPEAIMRLKDPEKLFAKILTSMVKRGVIYRTSKGQYEKRN